MTMVFVRFLFLEGIQSFLSRRLNKIYELFYISPKSFPISKIKGNKKRKSHKTQTEQTFPTGVLHLHICYVYLKDLLTCSELPQTKIHMIGSILIEVQAGKFSFSVSADCYYCLQQYVL